MQLLASLNEQLTLSRAEQYASLAYTILFCDGCYRSRVSEKRRTTKKARRAVVFKM
jgi:hypothetical protein